MFTQHIPSAVYAKYGPTVASEAKRQGIREELVWAVIAIESNFDDQALSPAGAIGLMQLMPATAEDLGVDPKDGHQNIKGGTAYLKQLLTRYSGVLSATLAAYNWGPGNLGLPARPPLTWPKETQKYLVRFINAYAKLTGVRK